MEQRWKPWKNRWTQWKKWWTPLKSKNAIQKNNENQSKIKDSQPLDKKQHIVYIYIYTYIHRIAQLIPHPFKEGHHCDRSTWGKCSISSRTTLIFWKRPICLPKMYSRSSVLDKTTRGSGAEVFVFAAIYTPEKGQKQRDGASPFFFLELVIYIYIYVYIHIFVCIYTYIWFGRICQLTFTLRGPNYMNPPWVLVPALLDSGVVNRCKY